MQKILENEVIEILIPKYVENLGNCTEIITKSKEMIVNKSIKSCIKNLAEYYCINLSSIRKQYGKELGIKNKVPIIVNSNLIYVPFKAREPLCKNDYASGYINIMSISQIAEENKRGVFIITNNKKIKTLQSKDALRRAVNYGKLAKITYYQKNSYQKVCEQKEPYCI